MKQEGKRCLFRHRPGAAATAALALFIGGSALADHQLPPGATLDFDRCRVQTMMDGHLMWVDVPCPERDARGLQGPAQIGPPGVEAPGDDSPQVGDRPSDGGDDGEDGDDGTQVGGGTPPGAGPADGDDGTQVGGGVGSGNPGPGPGIESEHDGNPGNEPGVMGPDTDVGKATENPGQIGGHSAGAGQGEEGQAFGRSELAGADAQGGGPSANAQGGKSGAAGAGGRGRGRGSP